MSERFDAADDAQVHEAMLEALEPVALPPERREAMRRRLLARVEAAGEAAISVSAASSPGGERTAADSGVPGSSAEAPETVTTVAFQRLPKAPEKGVEAPGGTRTVRAEECGWRAFSPKVQIKVLLQEGDSMSYLLRLEPGAMLPPHEHPQTEECIVLEGEVRMGDHVVRRGDYHVARGGLGHGLLRSDTGALIFLRGAVPSARQVRWRSLDAYAPLLPRALRERVGRWKTPR